MTIQRGSIFLLAACVLIATGQIAAQTSPSITLLLKSKEFDSGTSAQLLVTADVPNNVSEVKVDFVSPPGFVAEPASLRFRQQGKSISAVTVRRSGDVLTGEYSLLAHATAQPLNAGSSVLSMDQVVAFTYTNRLPASFYFLLGLAGFVLGYVIRTFTTVLRKIPAPSRAPEPDVPQDGPVTAFTKRHYYLVDFVVSIALAFVVLLYLMKEGHPPDSAAAWYGALLTGIGLGFLTNNDLLARVKA
jgi:hypothetical protein